jgi:translation initiation factor IF-2
VAQRELLKLGGKMASVRVVKALVGNINQSDVFLAETIKGSVLGYGVQIHKDAVTRAKNQIQLRAFALLQDVVAEARKLLEDALPRLEEEERIGRVEVRQVIKSSKLGKIAGCFVVDGVIRRSAQLRLVRDDVILWQGRMEGLKRFKDEVKEVRENFECGIRLAGHEGFQPGDCFEVFEIKKIRQRLI